jgi:hypothetical protein
MPLLRRCLSAMIALYAASALGQSKALDFRGLVKMPISL